MEPRSQTTSTAASATLCSWCKAPTGLDRDDIGYCSERCRTFLERAGRPTNYLRECGVPRRFLGVSLSTFTGPREPLSPLSDFPGCLSMVFLSGNVGAGKTHVAVSLLRDAATRDERRGLFVHASGLFLELRATMDNRAASEAHVFAKYLADRLLVVDDLGAEKVSEYVRASWYHIIETRYSEMRPTVVTSNLSLAQVAEAYGDRIASRLASGFVLNFAGGDYRLRLREQGVDR